MFSRSTPSEQIPTSACLFPQKLAGYSLSTLRRLPEAGPRHLSAVWHGFCHSQSGLPHVTAKASVIVYAAPQVIDARDPMGTRSPQLEHHLRKNARHKDLLLLLNKCDLVRLSFLRPSCL